MEQKLTKMDFIKIAKEYPTKGRDLALELGVPKHTLNNAVTRLRKAGVKIERPKLTNLSPFAQAVAALTK